MITKAGVEGRAGMVNATLERRGSTARVFVQARNGGTAVDLTTTEHAPGTAVRLLTIGTRGEAYRYLVAMSEALWALDAPFTS